MNGGNFIYRKITTGGSLKLGTILVITAIFVSAVAVLFVIHEGTDNTSAEITEYGGCGENAGYCIYSDGTLKIYGSGAMYDYGGFSERPPWFDCRDEITKIVIEDSITHLGQWAFVECKHVKELTIPITLNSVTVDTSCAFAGCYNIEKVTFTLGKDGYGFDYAAYLGNNAWYQLTPWYQSRDSLKEIIFADGITHIGADAFRELNITSIVLPDSVTSLGCHCFFDCTWLTSLTLPISLNPVGNETYPAFGGCTAIESVLFTLGNGVPFDYNTWVYDVDYDLLKQAPWNQNSAIAKDITISATINNMGRYMFYDCNIGHLTIPISANCVKSYAFGSTNYPSLKSIYITCSGQGVDYSDWQSVVCPWNNAENLELISLQPGIMYIGSYTFAGCKADSIILPYTLRELGKGSFEGSVVKNLTLTPSVNTVVDGDHPAFYQMSGLEKVTFTCWSKTWGCDYSIYDGDNFYQYTPWYQCRNTLKEIVFEDGIRHLGADAFRELNITSVVLPDSMASLGCHTFYNCSKLTDVTVPISLDCACSAKYSAFEGCTSITSLKFTAGTGVGVDYTTDCHPAWCTPGYNVTQISFDSGITYIGAHAFDQYLFVGKNGVLLQYSAADLGGHVFTRDGALMWMSDEIQEIPATDGLEEVDCASVPTVSIRIT